MAGYEDPWVLSIFMTILGTIGVLITLKKRHENKKDKYYNHIKDKVNQVYNQVTKNGKHLASPDFFGVIDTFRPEILQHLSTYQKKTKVTMYDAFWEISKAKSNKDKQKEVLNKKYLNDEFLKLHQKVNHDIEPEFGVCLECISKKEFFHFFSKKLKDVKC
jgi:hypothetical protein